MVILILPIPYIPCPLAPSRPGLGLGRSSTVDNSDVPPLMILELVFLCVLSIFGVTVRELYKFEMFELAENKSELLTITFPTSLSLAELTSVDFLLTNFCVPPG